MSTHSRTYLVLLAVDGNASRIVDVVRSAGDAGLAVLVVTDRRFSARVRAALDEMEVTEPVVDLVGMRSVALSSARGVSRRVIRALARRAGTFLYRGTRFFRHRMNLPESVDRMMEVNGRWARGLPNAANSLIDGMVDPLLVRLATLGTTARQTARASKAVRDLMRFHRVFGVVCLDGSSLLSGWLIARRYRGLPVLTNYPVDWDSEMVTRFEGLVSGSRW